MKIDVWVSPEGSPEITVSDVYSGFGVMTNVGVFGVAQRDGGIEIMFGGKSVWSSNELGPESRPMRLADGSAFMTAHWTLPKTHWLYEEARLEPPMPMRVGLSPERDALAAQVRAAARYAVRAATMNGKETGFDPDSLVQNMVVGLLGYWTEDGTSSTG
jgi:hypothetical protein